MREQPWRPTQQGDVSRRAVSRYQARSFSGNSWISKMVRVWHRGHRMVLAVGEKQGGMSRG